MNVISRLLIFGMPLMKKLARQWLRTLISSTPFIWWRSLVLVVTSSKFVSLPVCVVWCLTLVVRLLTVLLRQTSVKASPFWNTLFQRMAHVRVFPIPHSVRLTLVIWLVVWLMLHKMLLFARSTVVLLMAYLHLWLMKRVKLTSSLSVAAWLNRLLIQPLVKS